MFAIVDRSQLVMNAMLGAGNDALGVETTNYLKAAATIDLGVGDDRFDGKYYVGGVTHTFSHEPSHLCFTALIGEGNDSCRLQATGFDEVAALFNTGPAGGRDTVEVSLVHYPTRNLARQIDRTFDDGQDQLSLGAVGYEEVDLVPSSGDEREVQLI